jgi:1-deoxy-D-xylulose-5-phosphate synthase
LQRSYDEIVHDVCLQNLPVIFAIDRSGIVGDDGPTHHGLFDTSFLRHIPNLCIMAPKNSLELKQMLSLAVSLDSPSAIKYPRGTVIDELELLAADDVSLGRAEIMTEGNDLGIIALGQTVYPAYLAFKKLRDAGVGATLLNTRFVKPLDLRAVLSVGERTGRLLVVEENVMAGGLGSAVLEALNRSGISHIDVKILGIPDCFVQSGSQAELRSLYGLDEHAIYTAALALCHHETGR